jgi:hypothetical protein
MIMHDMPPPRVPYSMIEMRSDRPSVVSALSDSIPEHTRQFEVTYSVFSLGNGVFMRLKRPLVVKKVGRDAWIEDWGLTIQAKDLTYIEERIPRYFMEMYSKAKNGYLTEQEEEWWTNIIDSIDYTSLSKELCRPQYFEGEILQIHNNKGIYVKWQDDSTEWLSNKLRKSFKLFNKGDKFSAYIRRNRFNSVSSVENIELLNYYNKFEFHDIPTFCG